MPVGWGRLALGTRHGDLNFLPVSHFQHPVVVFTPRSVKRTRSRAQHLNLVLYSVVAHLRTLLTHLGVRVLCMPTRWNACFADYMYN